MPVKITALKETRPNENRVALVPSVAKRLQKLGIELSLAAGAGEAARIPDQAYSDAEITVGDAPIGEADIVLAVQPLTVEQVGQLKEGSIVFSHVHAHKEVELVKALRDRKITCFAMELVPRITRAQTMDALSAQAALAGY